MATFDQLFNAYNNQFSTPFGQNYAPREPLDWNGGLAGSVVYPSPPPAPPRWWDVPPADVNAAQPPAASGRRPEINEASNNNVTVSACLAVIDPPAEVTKDREFEADSWLILREAPDTKSKAVVKLGNKEKLEADEIRDDWTHVSNVIRLSEADGSPNQKLVQGWVRSKYLVERQCYDDPANGPLSRVVTRADGRGLDNALPPKEFDHPYQWHVDLVIIPTQQELASTCKYPPGENVLGCSQRLYGSCAIYRLPDDLLKKLMPTYPPEILMRHELGHCNGWGGTHLGARTYWYAK
jgi:hypothetical protein